MMMQGNQKNTVINKINYWPYIRKTAHFGVWKIKIEIKMLHKIDKEGGWGGSQGSGSQGC